MNKDIFSPEHNEKYSAFKTLLDISNIIRSSHDAEETLHRTAKMVAERMNVDICSIYVYDPKESCLLLKSSAGLNPDNIGKIKIPVSEGLVGLVLEVAEPVQTADMYSHPRFKFFPNTHAEGYSSFLGVPLIEHRKPFGVIVVNTFESRYFSIEEEEILLTIATQISGLISKALLIDKLDRSTEFQNKSDETDISTVRIIGTPVAPGVTMGRTVILQSNALTEPDRISNNTVEKELEFFNQALNNTINDLLDLIDKVSDFVSPDEAAIFHAHLMFLEDHGFQAKIQNHIKEGASAVWSIYKVIKEYLLAFEEIADPYLKERGADLKDVGYRLLHYLGHGHVSSMDREGILVSEQLLPGDIARLDTSKIKGIITSSGGVVSHTSILARSLLIPAICISEELLKQISENEFMVMDGKAGYAICNPQPQVIEEFERLLIEQEKFLSHLEKFRNLPCVTRNGQAITLLANVGLLADLHLVEYNNAEGIGLYRTEVYFLSVESYPSIDDQVHIYSKVIKSVSWEKPVVIRTLDIGSDKAAPYMGLPEEENPFLGNRAIRRQIENPHLLKQQIKAILIATGNKKNVKLLIPMISHLYEIKFVKKIYKDCYRELEEEGYRPVDIEIGMMFEVPAAVLLCEQFAHEVDFFSIGSNDLTQYVLAVDRNNPHIAHLYDPLNPAVLRLIEYLVRVADQYNIPIELCGELASDIDGCVILVGMGLRQLSMNAALIPLIKERLSQVALPDIENLARQALQMSSAQEVRELVTDLFKNMPSPA